MPAALTTSFSKRHLELRTGAALADDEIRRFAPTIYANDAHPSRSRRYAPIPTHRVLDRLRHEGFQPFSVAQSRARDTSRQAFTKHMIRLRHGSQVTAFASPPVETPEIILINSHDGSTSYQLLTGVFRFVCANGMVLGRRLSDVRIPHKGEVSLDAVVDSAYHSLAGFKQTQERIEAFKSVRLTPTEQHAYAEVALDIRFGPAAPFGPEKMLEARRVEDEGDSLWLTLQRVQENAIRGGLIGYRGEGVRRRRVTTRAIGNIDGSVAVNGRIWDLTERLYAHKTGAALAA